MLGIDLTKISRFADKDETFIKRILHPEEIKEFSNSDNKDRFLATRWAIKEALFKADNNLYNFNEINITKVDRVYTYEGYKISTSNEDDLIIAIAMKEK